MHGEKIILCWEDMAMTSFYTAGSCCVQGQACLVKEKGPQQTIMDICEQEAKIKLAFETKASKTIICQSLNFSTDCCCLACQS